MIEKMSAPIMAKNYSHCPLKKRPVHLCNDEPENLSTKPEDLSLTGRYTSSTSPSPVSSLHTTSPVSSPAASPVSKYPPHYPSMELSSDTYEMAPQTWHRSVAPTYPPPPSHYHFMYHPAYPAYHHADYMSMSPSSQSDNSLSPPHHTQHPLPLAPLALRPAIYNHPIDHYSLSPSSSSTASPPPVGPAPSASISSSAEDLSEKQRGSVVGVRHQCPDCGKSYSTFSGLSKHRQFHCAAGEAPRKSFSCKYCDKVYVSLGALKMHIRTHTLPCKCTICGKAFSRPWLLQGHIRTHTGEKPFSCQYCNRAFADRSNLRAHLQTHSDVKKYSCATCSKTFSRMSLLTKHAEGGCAISGPTAGVTGGDEAVAF